MKTLLLNDINNVLVFLKKKKRERKKLRGDGEKWREYLICLVFRG